MGNAHYLHLLDLIQRKQHEILYESNLNAAAQVLSLLFILCRSDSRMRTKPVIFMTLLLLMVLLMLPLCLADGGDASRADEGSFYTILLTK